MSTPHIPPPERDLSLLAFTAVLGAAYVALMFATPFIVNH